MKLLILIIFILTGSGAAKAAPVKLLQTDERGVVQSGSYADVAEAVANGSRVGVIYKRSGRVVSRVCGSLIDHTNDGTAHCFITDAFDTTNQLEFTNPVAFEYIIISTEGNRQTVKRDLSGNQLQFENGDCAGNLVCKDVIGVTWVSLD